MLNSIIIIAGIIFLAFFHLVLWRKLCIDIFQFNLIKIRDSLSDLFLEDDRLSSNHLAYQLLYAYTEAFIKYLPQMTFFTTQLSSLFIEDDKEFENELMKQIQILPEDVAQDLNNKYEAIHTEWVKYIFLTAPACLSLLLICYLVGTNLFCGGLGVVNVC